MECVFCNREEMKNRIIFEDRLVFVMPTNIPIVPGHLLICPVRHVQKLEDLEKEEFEAVFFTLSKIKKSLKKVFVSEGFNFAWNEGAVAGQSVPHFHLHVLPRKSGDSGIVEYEPRKFLYRPGSREVSPETELEEVARKIRENI